MHQVELSTGLVDGTGKAHKLAKLRQLTAKEIIEAQLAAERVVTIPTPKGPVPQMVSSPAALGYELLRRNIEQIGELPGPLTLEQLGRLTEADLRKLDVAVGVLDAAAANSAAPDSPSEVGEVKR